MNDPCIHCIELDRCSKNGIDKCNKKKAFIRYKEKCKEIAERTRVIMEKAKVTADEKRI